jgi:ubiquinone/menaquinone biosynthesis C-methylase UbiE
MVWEEYYSSLKELPDRLKRPVPFVVESLSLFDSCNVKNVLDLGCGAGRHCVFLAKEGFNVVGIDFSKSSLKIAGEWVRREKLENVDFVRGTITHLPFTANFFDAVISVSVLHHAVKRKIINVVREIHRVLRREGLLIANLASVEDHRFGKGERVEQGTFRIKEEFKEHEFEEIHHFFTREEASKLLADFINVKIETIDQHHKYWKVIAFK